MDLREHLATLERGGSRHRPIAVASASVVEVRTRALACPHCGGEYRIHDHVAVHGLRRVDVGCRQCSRPRSLWFKLVSFEPN
jgi:uncharacterized protein YbaR (Trm112 family)